MLLHLQPKLPKRYSRKEWCLIRASIGSTLILRR